MYAACCIDGVSKRDVSATILVKVTYELVLVVAAAMLAVGVHGDERLERAFLGLPARLEREAPRCLERRALTEVHGVARDDDAQSLRRRADRRLVDGRHAPVVDEEHAGARLFRWPDVPERRGELLERAREAAFLVERGHEDGDAHRATLP